MLTYHNRESLQVALAVTRAVCGAQPASALAERVGSDMTGTVTPKRNLLEVSRYCI